MATTLPNLVVGIDVGGTNTDTVLMDGKEVLGWHKVPTTHDLGKGVSTSIAEVLRKTGIAPDGVAVVKIGTTQFVNAIVEKDASKMDRVAVIRLCGPYTKSVKPFGGFPKTLRTIVEGHHGFVDGGMHVTGEAIVPLSEAQLREQAAAIKAHNIKSIALVGVNSPAYPAQEKEAAGILSRELGPGFDISCSHEVARTGFLERENTVILNASIRRFARRVVCRLTASINALLPRTRVFLTTNDGAVCHVDYAAQYPLRCYSSGPTNSARGAAFLAGKDAHISDDNPQDILVIDVGGTTTDVCSLLPNGYPKQSPAFVKVAGVKTSFSMPDVHDIGLGGGSVVRTSLNGAVTVGPDSVAAEENTQSLASGGKVFTASDLANLRPEKLSAAGHSQAAADAARNAIKEKIENAVDYMKTSPADAKVLLVGGGCFILPDSIQGVNQVIRPPCWQVANAVGAAIGKVSANVERMIIPNGRPREEIIEEGKAEAINLCGEAGGNLQTAEIVECDTIAETYSTDGTYLLTVRAVSDIGDLSSFTLSGQQTDLGEVEPEPEANGNGDKTCVTDEKTAVDIEAYRPHIENGVWTLSETDIDLLISGTGVLGVGCVGESTNYMISLKDAIREGQPIRVVPHTTVQPEDVIVPACWIGAPTEFFERLPSGDEMQEAIYANLELTGVNDFKYTLPSEIGGINALEALHLAATLGKSALDADMVGRAFPRTWMTVRGIMGENSFPAAMADGNGAVVTLKRAKNDYQAEDFLRANCTQMKQIAALAVQPFTGDQMDQVVHGSYSLAWTLGREMELASQRKMDVAEAVASTCSGRVIYTGKVNMVDRHVQGSFTRGMCTIVPLESNLPSTATEEVKKHLELTFENEYILAALKSPRKSGCEENQEPEVLALTPDLIATLDASNGMTVGITELRYGIQVKVVALPASEIWYSEEGLRRCRPPDFNLGNLQGKGLRHTKPTVSLFERYGR